MSTIILPQDMRAPVALEQVAKILSNNTPDDILHKYNQEIFEIIFGISLVKDGLNYFFKKTTDESATILKAWVTQESVTDIIELKREPTEFCFIIKASRIPLDLYEKIGKNNAIELAGRSLALAMEKPVNYVYGDSRQYTGYSKTSNKFKNIAFIFGYKEDKGRYS